MSDDKHQCCSRRILGRRTVLTVLSMVVLGTLVCAVAASLPGILRRAEQRKQRTVWEGVLEENPTNADALWQLAILYGFERRHEEALECARRAVELAPDHAYAWPTYGRKALVIFRTARNARRRADALRDLERAAEGLRQLCRDGVHLSRKQGPYAKNSVFQDWAFAALFFNQAGRLDEAGEAYSMAVAVAREMADSEDPLERELGQRNLKWVRDEDPWGLRIFSEELNELGK